MILKGFAARERDAGEGLKDGEDAGESLLHG